VARVLVGDPQVEGMERWERGVRERLGEVQRGEIAVLQV
jgi:hypothetical protein